MTARWQRILAQGFGDAKTLLSYLGLPVDLACEQASQQFPTRVPKGFVDRMVPGDANDPLLKQVLAVSDEMDSVDGYINDPLQETRQNPVPGLIHKYHGRVLLTAAGACAINCRYCFRRYFPYHENTPGKGRLQKALEYIASDNSLHEVILSGGDPLLISDTQLQKLMAKIELIPHIRTIRFHTRIPVVLPERITPALVEVMRQSRCQLVMVLHCNHPNELIPSLKPLFENLRQAGVHMLNQSVLLHQVNDQIETLVALSHQLFEYGVLPYYLHTLDKVTGTAHFDLNLQEAKILYQQMQEQLPGYLVPKLATEKAGERHKILLSSASKISYAPIIPTNPKEL